MGSETDLDTALASMGINPQTYFQRHPELRPFRDRLKCFHYQVPFASKHVEHYFCWGEHRIGSLTCYDLAWRLNDSRFFWPGRLWWKPKSARSIKNQLTPLPSAANLDEVALPVESVAILRDDEKNSIHAIVFDSVGKKGVWASLSEVRSTFLPLLLLLSYPSISFLLETAPFQALWKPSDRVWMPGNKRQKKLRQQQLQSEAAPKQRAQLLPPPLLRLLQSPPHQSPLLCDNLEKKSGHERLLPRRRLHNFKKEGDPEKLKKPLCPYLRPNGCYKKLKPPLPSQSLSSQLLQPLNCLPSPYPHSRHLPLLLCWMLQRSLSSRSGERRIRKDKRKGKRSWRIGLNNGGRIGSKASNARSWLRFKINSNKDPRRL